MMNKNYPSGKEMQEDECFPEDQDQDFKYKRLLRTRKKVTTVEEYEYDSDIKEESKEENTTPKYPVISNDDPYVWCDFVNDHAKPFDSFESLKKSFILNYPRVLSYIRSGDGYFLKKDGMENLHNMCFPTFKFKYENSVVKKNKVLTTDEEATLEKMIDECHDSLPMYSKRVFKPRNKGMKRYEYNTWNEFIGHDDEILKPDMDVVQPILDYLQEVMSDGDEKSYKYQLSWLANAVQTPSDRPGVAMVYYSEQGCGKGVWTSFLSDKVFGKHCSKSVSGLTALTQRFNGVCDDVMFMVVDEMSSTTKRFHADFDKMKGLLTEKTVMIEPKGKPMYTVDNHMRFMMTTNNSHTLKVEVSDRRYAMLELSDKYKGNYKYWKHLSNNVLTEEGGKHFYRYLMCMEKRDLVNVRNIPKTKLKEQAKELSQSNSMHFISQIRSDEYDLGLQSYIEDRKIQPSELYNSYKGWCAINNEKAYKSRIFFTEMKKNFKQQNKRINGRQMRFYDFA